MSLRDLERDYEKSEDDIKALQSVGQIIGEVLKQLDEERCKLPVVPLPPAPPNAELIPFCATQSSSRLPVDLVM